jgi:hypothetical protein
VSGCSLYPKLAFFALRDIKVGEELTFDYHPQQPHNKPKPKVSTLHSFSEPWAGTYIYMYIYMNICTIVWKSMHALLWKCMHDMLVCACDCADAAGGAGGGSGVPLQGGELPWIPLSGPLAPCIVRQVHRGRVRVRVG